MKPKGKWVAYYRDLGRRITELRKYHKMSQAELAYALGVSQQSVFAYELGDRRVTVPLLPKLSQVLGVTVAELVELGRTLHPRAPRSSPKILRHAERIQRLTRTQQRFVIKIIDVLEGHASRPLN